MQCKTMYETVCSTKYVEKHKGVFVGDSKCERMPIKMCGKGCTAIELKEQCRDEEVMVQITQEYQFTIYLNFYINMPITFNLSNLLR